MYKNIFVIGSGMTGSTIARCLAENGIKVSVIERRSHLAGNMFDPILTSGHRIHQYGPHAFHTNSEDVFKFLSNFTKWNMYEHRVVANVHGNIIPVPFNFTSIEKVFGEDSKKIISHLKSKYKDNDHIPILKMLKSEDQIEKRIAGFAYKNIFETYTLKQWGMKPEEINPNVTARVPIRMGYDDRYFLDKYQGIPKNGYISMIENMLSHENINIVFQNFSIDSVEKNCLYIYTGAVDELLNYTFGILPYRSLSFEFEIHNGDNYLPTAQMNFTVDENYTRISDFSHMTGQKIGSTVIAKEYSNDFIPNKNEPFYPIPNDEPRVIHKKYLESILNSYPNILLAGRLADYKYYNMDQACARGLSVVKSILNDILDR